jgi:organic hydroperoxide reductase OsmC/OhrA
MRITASIENTGHTNAISVSTNSVKKEIAIPGKDGGGGSAVNGGELLFLALATCFCNDIYREAAKRKMDISAVVVSVSGEFGGEGESASNIVYETKILAPAHTSQEIADLILYVDQIAEIHNTVRKGVPVSLKN